MTKKVKPTKSVKLETWNKRQVFVARDSKKHILSWIPKKDMTLEQAIRKFKNTGDLKPNQRKETIGKYTRTFREDLTEEELGTRKPKVRTKNKDGLPMFQVTARAKVGGLQFIARSFFRQGHSLANAKKSAQQNLYKQIGKKVSGEYDSNIGQAEYENLKDTGMASEFKYGTITYEKRHKEKKQKNKGV